MCSAVIVDLQGFKLQKNNEFICKEFAVINIESGLCLSRTFKPPFSWSKLNRKDKQNVRWLTKNLHNLEWTIGDLPYSEIGTTIQDLLDEIDKIYVKGLEKISWLQVYVNKEIINLEELDCPKLTTFVNSDQACTLHTNNCATANVNGMFRWFKDKFTMFNAFESFHQNGGILSFLTAEEIAQLPMEFIMVYAGKEIETQWEKFPNSWKTNEKFLKYRCCFKHSNQPTSGDVCGFTVPRRYNCVECNKYVVC